MALADKEPKLMAEMLTMDLGRKGLFLLLYCPITLAQGIKSTWVTLG